nr:kielin/chordin-like protein [Cherax quadricarinatus]
MWSPDECHTCVCNGSEVSCSKTPESCPLPPNKFCVENPGRCCPQWNCSFGCIDDAGEHHELGSSWHSSPCTYHTCTQNGMITLIEDCFLPPPVHHSCTEITQENECCPRWHCSGCTDVAGNYHELCHEWTDSDPCLVFTCTPHGISEKLLVCEKQDQPHAGCYNYTSPGECCPKWNCSGCVDQSGYHPFLSKWTSDFCTTHSCTWNGIQTTREDCELEPAPHHTCLQYTPPQQCCPQWKCSSCVDNGKSRRLYEFWKSDSCTTNFCTKNGTQTIRETCKKTDAPHPSCQKILPEGECCPDWRCRGCFDASGNYHEIDDEWSMKDPCLMFLCSDEGIIMKRLKCTRTPSLYPHTDSCTTHVCTRDGVQVLKETCTLGPATSS